MLVSAFIGPEWKDLYDYALNNEYRFLSYGDAMLLKRKAV
jgi:S-adenosylmethionine:tRNA ribosyltransferase-isomerase